VESVEAKGTETNRNEYAELSAKYNDTKHVLLKEFDNFNIKFNHHFGEATAEFTKLHTQYIQDMANAWVSE